MGSHATRCVVHCLVTTTSSNAVQLRVPDVAGQTRAVASTEKPHRQVMLNVVDGTLMLYQSSQPQTTNVLTGASAEDDLPLLVCHSQRVDEAKQRYDQKPTNSIS